MISRPPFFSPGFLAWLGCLTAFVAVPVLAQDLLRFPPVLALYAVSFVARFLAPRKPRLIEPTEGAGARLPWLGLGMAAVLIAVFAYTFPATKRPFGLVPYGANFPLWWTQLYRLPMSNLLHADLAHLAANVSVLIVVSVWGQRLGVWLGSGLFAAAVAGEILYWRPSAAYVLGASGFVFSALGAWRFHPIRQDQRVARAICFAFLLLHCALNLWGASVNLSMHLGGLIAGFVLARVLPRYADAALASMYAVCLVIALVRADMRDERLAVREYASVATSPEELGVVAEYYVAEAQVTGGYGLALNRVRPMLGDTFYVEPPSRPKLLVHFAELLVLSWQRGIRGQPVDGKESCGVVVQDRTAVAVFCGFPPDDKHVVVFVTSDQGGRYKRWPVQ